MKLAIDMAYKSLNHVGEELCGDKVEMVDTEDSRILILADGMGSGIRANILSTLTSKIIATMMYNHLSMDDVIPTIAKTLPISSVNGVAYATFSIIQVFHNGEVYVAEYDNPECVCVRDGKVCPLPFQYREIEGKNIRECRIQSQIGDAFVIMSDGCLYCGTENIINYSWDWKKISSISEDAAARTRTAAQMASSINRACEKAYGGVCTDDTTVAVARIGEDKAVNILTGPPVHREDDSRIVHEFMETEGVHIVSGGVTGHIVSRELSREMVTAVGELDPEIPPTARIDGIDLVTEGIVTLHKVVDLLEQYQQDDVSEEFFEELSRENGATRMVCYFMEDCTTVNLFVGTAVNQEYTEKNLPFAISARKNLMGRLEDALKAMHKQVVIRYY